MNGIRLRKTGAPDVIATSDGRLTRSVPIQIKRRSGRKLVTLPSGEAAGPRPWDVTATPMQLALARGHRWLAMLAPDIVAAILDETLPQNVTVHELAISPSVLWEEQRERCGWRGPAAKLVGGTQV